MEKRKTIQGKSYAELKREVLGKDLNDSINEFLAQAKTPEYPIGHCRSGFQVKSPTVYYIGKS